MLSHLRPSFPPISAYRSHSPFDPLVQTIESRYMVYICLQNKKFNLLWELHPPSILALGYSTDRLWRPICGTVVKFQSTRVFVRFFQSPGTRVSQTSSFLYKNRRSIVQFSNIPVGNLRDSSFNQQHCPVRIFGKSGCNQCATGAT